MDKSTISKNLLFTQKHFDLLMKLNRASFVERNSVENIYNIITESAVDGLNIDRAGFWKIIGNQLVCINLFDKDDGFHSIEKNIEARDLPVYFKALTDGIAIVADDVLTNKYTQELKESYLVPLGITDMLDLPIRENGKVIGVLCCEHRDNPRVWSDSDFAFAKSVADVLTLFLEQKKRLDLETELIESERKLSLITDNSLDGFVVFENKEVTYVSPSYYEMLGYTETEALSFTLDDIFNSIHPDDVFQVKAIIYDNLSKKIKNFKCEFRFRGKSGKYFWREDTASIVYDKNGFYSKYIIISRDITLMKNAEIKIEKLFNISKNQNKKLLDFTHIISHNIRSNTSNMSMIIDLIEETKDETEKKEYFDLLKQSNEKLSDTIHYLNETINIQLSSTDQKVKLNLKSEIEKSLKAINGIIKSQQVTVNINIPIDMEINGIPSYLESIMFNLISNAIKYKFPTRNPIIDINALKTASKFIISVKDNGLGIDMVRNKDKIFGMYKTFHGNEDAVGLGLFMTKNHVIALGGNIDVESQVGIGSVFKVTLYE